MARGDVRKKEGDMPMARLPLDIASFWRVSYVVSNGFRGEKLYNLRVFQIRAVLFLKFSVDIHRFFITFANQ